MKKIISYLFICMLSGSILCGCDNDEPGGESIFVDPTIEKTEFDKWLVANYLNPYNIRLLYRLKDIETDFTYNVVPAQVDKSKEMAVMLKHLWLEAYAETIGGVEGLNFIRSTAPKLFHFVGSAEFNPESGTVRLGAAEGGMKITITEVNSLDAAKLREQEFFGTIHHEFGHILNQEKEYPLTFNEISVGNYAPTTWHQRDIEEMNQLGFVTLYAGSSAEEDFVEIIARYVTWSSAQWKEMLETAGEGREIIEEKLNIVRLYMYESWNIDLDKLHDVVQRRVSEIQSIDLNELYNETY